ncbi:SprB repeat-containing protein, partial [Flavobacteriales bacterium]|nr:SprB repeat-containing protein [Flavobacteriales bacterium]
MNKIWFFIFAFLFVQVLSAQVGCTDELSVSYDPAATIDDPATCFYVGCFDSDYLEYYTQAIASSVNFSNPALVGNFFDDGSCSELVIEGCTNPAYDEFDPMANFDNGSCVTFLGSNTPCLAFEYSILDNCDDTWVVEFDFSLINPISGFDISVDVINSSGANFVFSEIPFGDDDFDLSFTVDEADSFMVFFTTNENDCSLAPIALDFVSSSEVLVPLEVTSPSCAGDFGTISGTIEGSTGIYSVLINGFELDQVTVGISNIVYDGTIDVYSGDNNSIDCEGNIISSPVNASVNLANISGLQNGDQIGAFFNHPTCGLTNIGSAVYNGSDVFLPIWGDDASTAVYEGAPNGDAIFWLAYRPSNGEIYNLDIVWTTIGGLSSGDQFINNALIASSSVTVGPTFEEDSFEISWPAGIWDLEITNGTCTVYEEAIDISAPPSLDDVIYSSTDNNCPGDTDGTITVDGLNESNIYTLTLIDSGTIPPPPPTVVTIDNSNSYTFSGLAGSTYFLNVEDLTCGQNDLEPGINVGGGDEIIISPISNIELACFGDNDGVIVSDVSGGSGSYSYSWSATNGGLIPPGQVNSPDLAGLVAGTYTLEVSDGGLGCPSVQESFEVVQPDDILILSILQNASCETGLGAIDITVLGGTGTYSYLWTGPTFPGFANSEDISNLEPGVYNLTVTDGNLCPKDLEVEVFGESGITSVSVFQTPVTCPGGSDGSVDIVVNGGSGSYSYSWTASNGGEIPFGQESNQNLTGLTGGVYTVSVSDINSSCDPVDGLAFVSDNFFTTEIQVDGGVNLFDNGFGVSCFNESDGSIDVNISGGTGPTTYTYSWTGSNGFLSNNEDLNNLFAGDYTLVVSGSDGCSS